MSLGFNERVISTMASKQLKKIELTGKYTSVQVTELLGVPPKTIQGALTNSRFERAGVPKRYLPKKDAKGVWRIPAAGLAFWYNQWRSKPKNVEVTVAAAPAKEPAAAAPAEATG